MKKNNRWTFKEKHHADVWKAMKLILDTETWEAPMSDEALTQAIRDRGVYTTPTITRDVRLEHNIGNADERRVAIFAREAKAKGKK